MTDGLEPLYRGRHTTIPLRPTIELLQSGDSYCPSNNANDPSINSISTPGNNGESVEIVNKPGSIQLIPGEIAQRESREGESLGACRTEYLISAIAETTAVVHQRVVFVAHVSG